MEGGHQYLPAFPGADKVVRLAPSPDEAAISSEHLPVHRCQRTSAADGDGLQIQKAAVGVAVLAISVDDTLEEARKLFPGLKAVDGSIASHGDGRHVVQRSNLVSAI